MVFEQGGWYEIIFASSGIFMIKMTIYTIKILINPYD